MNVVIPIFLAGGGAPLPKYRPMPALAPLRAKALPRAAVERRVTPRLVPRPCKFCKVPWQPRASRFLFCSRACAGEHNGLTRTNRHRLLTWPIVEAMRVAYAKGGMVADIARAHATSYWTTRDVVVEKTWRRVAGAP